MIVTDRDLRPVWRAQAQFNPSVAAVNVHFGIRWIEKDVVVRKEAAIAVVPTSKLRIARLDVAEIRLCQLHRYVVIVEIPERMTIEREESVFAHGSLDMQILNTAVHLIAW